MLKKLLSIIFLFCFTLSYSAEAKKHWGRYAHSSIEKKKVAKKSTRRKPAGIVTKKSLKRTEHRTRKQTCVVASKENRSKKEKTQKNQKRRGKAHSRMASAPYKRFPNKSTPQRSFLTQKHSKVATPSANIPRKVPIAKPTTSPAAPLTYLSQLNAHMQKNAKGGGLDHLYSKRLEGQGQTVAVVEFSGDWKELRDTINNNARNFSPQIRENYRCNFLPSIGGPGLHPEEKNDLIRNSRENLRSPYHGSRVASVVLDLAPKAKVLPVSTYFTSLSDSYDQADALLHPSMENVGIINVSSGYIRSDSEFQRSGNRPDGSPKYLFKDRFPEQHLEAIKTVVRAGKVLVFAAGNKGRDIRGPEFTDSFEISLDNRFLGYLMENLDEETLQSIIIAGNLDPETKSASPYSNKPGNSDKLQDRFLYASGYHSYNNQIVSGTSFSAPYICALIANLCAKPGVTPKMAVKALVDSADERPEKEIYGRGVIRADKALELLERGGPF